MAQENVQPLQQQQRASLQLGETIVTGKISVVRQPKDSEFTFYNINQPSTDEYSNPSLIQVRQNASERPFGKEEDVVRIRAKIGGYGRRNDGVLYVTNTLDFIALA